MHNLLIRDCVPLNPLFFFNRPIMSAKDYAAVFSVSGVFLSPAQSNFSTWEGVHVEKYIQSFINQAIAIAWHSL